MNDNDLNGSSLPEPCIIVIFGVTGDLARRELMPDLYEFTRQRRSMPGAYEWLLQDSKGGHQTFSPQVDWILRAWQLVDPIVGKWASAPRADLPNFEARSWGRDIVEHLLPRDRRRWHAGPSINQKA